MHSVAHPFSARALGGAVGLEHEASLKAKATSAPTSSQVAAARDDFRRHKSDGSCVTVYWSEEGANNKGLRPEVEKGDEVDVGRQGGASPQRCVGYG